MTKEKCYIVVYDDRTFDVYRNGRTLNDINLDRVKDFYKTDYDTRMIDLAEFFRKDLDHRKFEKLDKAKFS